MSNNKIFITTQPKEFVVFTKKESKQSSILEIQNLTQFNVAFKVKSNAPNNYLVSPSKGILTSQPQVLKITALTIPEPSHSLMILAAAADENTSISIVLNNPKQCQRLKIRVLVNDKKKSSTKQLDPIMKPLSNEEESEIKALNEEKSILENDLKKILEELKECRIETLKHLYKNDRDFGYTHALLCLIFGIIFGVITPIFLI